MRTIFALVLGLAISASPLVLNSAKACDGKKCHNKKCKLQKKAGDKAAPAADAKPSDKS